MRASDEQYRLLVQCAPDGIILTDLDGIILIANAAAAELCDGGSPDALLGTSFLDLVTVDDRSRLRAVMDEALHGGSIQNAECRLHRGQDRVVAGLALSVVTDEAGNPSGFVTVVRDMTRDKLREAQLKDQTLHDPLTGLPNRVLLLDRLRQAIESTRRIETQVSVLYIDLDHFKEVNDHFGHDFGDLLLQQTAHCMQQTLRASDTLGRLGGDEFAVVLPQTDVMGATVIAGKLKDELDASFQIADHVIDVGASIGIAVYPVHGEDATSLLRQADRAMYADKRSGWGNLVQHSGHQLLLERRHLPTDTLEVSALQVDPRVLALARVCDDRV